MTPVADGEAADVVIDCFGMMHAADQHAALAERTARVAPGGVLLLQFHSLDTILRGGQWNALRHGHFAYYSTSALTGMFAAHGFNPRTAWHVRALRRHGPAGRQPGLRRTPCDRRYGAPVRGPSDGTGDPAVLGRLQSDVADQAAGLGEFLAGQRAAGRPTLGYGAASRAVALLRRAGVDRPLLPAVVDASTAKHGLRMPGTDIPIVGPAGWRTPDRPRWCCSWPTCCPRSGPPIRRSRPEAGAG